MATVQQVAKAALQRILVQASEAPLEADEYADFILALNNFMAQLAADRIDLGYTEVTNISDEVTVPAGALRGIIANLAVEVAPDYGATASQELIAQAVSGLKTIRRLGMCVAKARFPSTLPVGSGNADYGSAFYPGCRAGCQCDACLLCEAQACAEGD